MEKTSSNNQNLPMVMGRMEMVVIERMETMVMREGQR